MQACDGVLADLAEHHRLLMTRTKALKGTEKVMLSCADWAELAGDYDLPRLSNICIKHFIEGNRVFPEQQIMQDKHEEKDVAQYLLHYTYCVILLLCWCTAAQLVNQLQDGPHGMSSILIVAVV